MFQLYWSFLISFDTLNTIEIFVDRDNIYFSRSLYFKTWLPYAAQPFFREGIKAIAFLAWLHILTATIIDYLSIYVLPFKLLNIAAIIWKGKIYGKRSSESQQLS